MSLNGLDAPQLQQIFDNACAEPGSWFLLQYASRDEVELLAKGTNGAQEMREHIAQAADDSPLYGFLRYRRRNILLKYLPEGTSRVLKARSQVHFHLVGERFSPHDVTFSIALAKELTDSALTSACSTHSASASISSSSSSLRNRRLADIAESAEESGQPEGQSFNSSPSSLSSSLSEKEHGRSGPAVIITAHDPTLSIGSVMEGPFGQSEPRQGELLTSARDDASSLNHPYGQGLSAGSLEQRRSSAPSDTRPPITDFYGSLYTPKVKLGPRLSADTTKRPHTANSNNSTFTASFEELRPVASVPKSVQIPHRKAGHSKERANSVASDSSVPRPQTSSTTSEDLSPLSRIETPPPIPEVIVVPQPPPSSPPALSPEKQRLMKALQLRKNTMRHDGEHTTDSNVEPLSAETGPTGKATAYPDNQPGEQDSRDDQSPKENEVDDQTENTKVRGSDNEHDSDASSVRSVEIAVAEPRPVSALLPRGPVTVTTTQGAQRPSNFGKFEEKKPSIAPIVLTKWGQKEPSPAPEDPVVETARSVSAPFLNNARRERASVAVPRTVTVSSGSVFQRIKQLEMLNQNAPPASSPARSPSTRSISAGASPARSPSPAPSLRRTLPKPNGTTIFPLERTPSPQAPKPFSPIMPKLKRIEVKPDPKPMALEVTTKIPRHNEIPQQPSMVATPIAQMIATPIANQPFPNLRGKTPTETKAPKKAASASPVVNAAPSVQPSLKELEASTPMASSRRSLDMSSIFGGSRKGSIDQTASVKEKSSFREKASALLHKLNMDVDDLPPLPTSPMTSQKSASPVSPVSTVATGKPKSIFGRDKEKNNEKRQEKKQEKEKNRSRSRSPKAEKKSLLRRMSSMTRKSRESPPPPAQAPVEPPPKTNLLAGWVNVQLPDTMLWRRKCIKVDSTGWLFLASTDDETAPGTRKYHIPTDIRIAKIPDPDEQELPFSVQLDLYEGGTLQCACQNTMEQKEVLSIIQSCFS